MRRIQVIFIAVALLTSSASITVARSINLDRPVPSAAAVAEPAYCNVAHNVGQIALGISNSGTFATNLSWLRQNGDCFTGEALPSCEYPRGGGTQYVWAGDIWVGAIVGSDTLVSTGADGWAVSGREFHPDEAPNGNMIYHSITDPTSPAYFGAVSEQDFVAVYYDTCLLCFGVSPDPVDGRAHRPLNIEVTQKSYAWSYAHADDFVLFDYTIRNMGAVRLEQAYVGFYVDADINDLSDQGGFYDDFTGFRKYQPVDHQSPECPDDSLEMNLSWAADNDGDLEHVIFRPVPHVTGFSIIDATSESLKVSYNWWISNMNGLLDFGPMRRSNYRNFGTGGSGTPEGDRNKYFLLSNGDIDYDQYRVGTIGSVDPIWLPPPVTPAPYWATGVDTRYLISLGPFDIDPGGSARIVMAYVGGENLHTDPANFLNLPYNPDAYGVGLDFTDLAANAKMAAWVYDNPGVDSDSDGYAGEFIVCNQGGEVEDTIWTKGDGIPDFRATSPPVAPISWVEAFETSIRIRWNGFKSETARDPLSRLVDFEGYHAYLSTTGSPGSFSKVGSYDIEDFYAYYWDADSGSWQRHPFRLTLEETLCAYAAGGCEDPTWYPLDYTRQQPFLVPDFPDSILYFEPVLANASQFGHETPFVKRFPAATKPGYTDPKDVPGDSTTFYLTDDGYFKYYEYETVIDNLLPERQYWVGITAFKVVSLLSGAVPTETNINHVDVEITTGGGANCCQVRVGDVNGLDGDEPTLGDVALLIDALFISNDIGLLPCLAEADINQSGRIEPTPNDITISDISILIDYLFITGPIRGLPDCL